MKKEETNPCGLFFLYILMMFFVYVVIKLVSYFQTPKAVEQTLEFLKGLGICVGLAFLAFIALSVYGIISARNPRPRLDIMSKEYPVRCNSVERVHQASSSAAAELKGITEPEVELPVFLLLSITNYGPCLMPLPDDYAWESLPADNSGRFRRLNNDHPGPVIVPMGFYSFQYLLYNQQAAPTFESPPVQSSGFYGIFPPPPTTSPIKLVISYKSIYTTEKLDYTILLDPYLKLALTALDKDGQDDWSTTAEVINALYQHVIDAQNTPGDDDSWMYQSRPIFPPWYC